ncbi:MAG: hypothetical protein L0H84_07000 [Pseudonocardia sp.]|nr:hypothetical protein [Pseudonocardia sp.]
MASSALPTILILVFVIAMLLRTIGQMTVVLASISMTVMKMMFSAVGVIVATLAILVLLGGVALGGGDLVSPVPTVPAPHPDFATIPDGGTDTNLLQPVDPDNPGVG